jgi:3-oxoacyl-[acyl-carrier-protein] synthase-3
MISHQQAGIQSTAVYLPDQTFTVDELEARGLLRGSAETLKAFGFGSAHVAVYESNIELAVSAAEKLLEHCDVDRNEIGMILYAAAMSSSATLWASPAGATDRSVLSFDGVADLFKYPASVLQYELELPNASVAGINQLGCASIFAALRHARALLLAEEDLQSVLCVSADKFPPGHPRDLAYTLVSDGACAALVRRNSSKNQIVACTQVTKGAHWDTETIENEIIASYFPTATALIDSTLRKAGLTIDDIALVIPHNVSLRSWEILGRLIGCPADRIYTDNIAAVGHTIASDTLLNLERATNAGRVKKGDFLLLFTFGYGSNWACMIVQH